MAQDRPIGYWRSHLPYNSGIGIATDGSNLFTITTQSFFTYKGINNNGGPTAYSKVDGMSGVGMKCVGYDATTSTTVLVYEDGNIDLFKEDENTFYNIPDFKIKSISGNKSVYSVYTENGTAYIATSIGILVINLATHDITENYQFVISNQIIPAYAFVGRGDQFYTITPGGIYKADKANPQLQNFQVWTQVDTISTIRYMASINNVLYLASQTAVYTLINDTLHHIYTCPTGSVIEHIDAGITELLVSEFTPDQFTGVLKMMNASAYVSDTFKVDDVKQAVQLGDSSIWVASVYKGMQKINFPSGTIETHIPSGPTDVGCFDIYANNKELWLCHGGFSDGLYALPSFSGVSHFVNNDWQHFRRYEYTPMDNFDDVVAVTKDESTGSVYLGSFLNGLFTLNTDGSHELLNGNSIFDSSTAYFGGDQRQVIGVATDAYNNLWVSTLNAQHNMYLKTSDGVWQKIELTAGINGGQILADDNGQVWMASIAGAGLVVYDPKGTFDNQLDDEYYHLTSGVGSGNLPSNKVFCIAKDKNNNIWVGTDNGIGIVSNCSAPGPCDAQIPIVQYDKFAGYLFAGNTVRSIAVDGGNRKWVGTDDGVWLLSPNADKIVYRFTAENSPLPSNHIRKIAIDNVTGDVYIGTEAGLVSYRSTAIDGSKSNSNVEVFPNPVTSDYTGTIAIKGLAANADVRITDINGQLVYRTTAYGGQAVWNGKDYTGHRPQSGIYLVFISSSDGNELYTAKIAFMQ